MRLRWAQTFLLSNLLLAEAYGSGGELPPAPVLSAATSSSARRGLPISRSGAGLAKMTARNGAFLLLCQESFDFFPRSLFSPSISFPCRGGGGRLTAPSLPFGTKAGDPPLLFAFPLACGSRGATTCGVHLSSSLEPAWLCKKKTKKNKGGFARSFSMQRFRGFWDPLGCLDGAGWPGGRRSRGGGTLQPQTSGAVSGDRVHAGNAACGYGPDRRSLCNSGMTGRGPGVSETRHVPAAEGAPSSTGAPSSDLTGAFSLAGPRSKWEGPPGAPGVPQLCRRRRGGPGPAPQSDS